MLHYPELFAMKIVIVTPYFAPAWTYGGPPKVLFILARTLLRHGHSVTVITTDALDQRRNPMLSETIDGVKVRRFRNALNFIAYHHKVFFIPNLCHRSRAILDTADVVLFSDVRSILNWQLFTYVRMRHIRYGVFAFGQIPYDAGWKNVIKRCFDVLWVKRFIRSATWRFAQTEHERTMYVHYFGVPKSKTHLLLLPVDVPRMLRFHHARRSKKKIILFVGRFHYLKGVDILLRSVIPLLRRDKSLQLVLIGRDDGAERILRRMIPNDIKSSVIFTGPLYGESISFWYRRASCFVFTPRYYEETSAAALEALAHGCPVVTVHQSEIPFLSEYNAGAVASNHIQSIRKVVLAVLRNTDSMRENAVRLIRDWYRVDTVVKKLLAYIQI